MEDPRTPLQFCGTGPKVVGRNAVTVERSPYRADGCTAKSTPPLIRPVLGPTLLPNQPQPHPAVWDFTSKRFSASMATWWCDAESALNPLGGERALRSAPNLGCPAANVWNTA